MHTFDRESNSACVSALCCGVGRLHRICNPHQEGWQGIYALYMDETAPFLFSFCMSRVGYKFDIVVPHYLLSLVNGVNLLVREESL